MSFVNGEEKLRSRLNASYVPFLLVCTAEAREVVFERLQNAAVFSHPAQVLYVCIFRLVTELRVTVEYSYEFLITHISYLSQYRTLLNSSPF